MRPRSQPFLANRRAVTRPTPAEAPVTTAVLRLSLDIRHVSVPFSLESRLVAAGCRITMHLSGFGRSEEHTSELQSQSNLVCRLLLEKKKNIYILLTQ